MNDNDKIKFAELITGHAEQHGKSVSKVGLRIWWNALHQYSIGQVDSAFNAQARQSEFMPKIAEIIRQIEGTPEDAALEAWAKVDRAIRRIGTGPAWVFDDAKIHRTLERMGGISIFSQATEQELPHMARNFCKHYSSAMNTGAYPARLSGWYTDTDAVRFIGNESECRKVLSGGAAETISITQASEALQQFIEHREEAKSA